MDQVELQSRLSRIETQWSLLKQAHEASSPWASTAQAQLLQRYRGALFRYVLVLTRSLDDAEDLLQEFAVRFLKGDFAAANSRKGSFRAYLKTSIIHMVSDQRRNKQRREAKQKAWNVQDQPDHEPAAAHTDHDFDESWRDDLLSRTWQRLQDYERATAKPYYQMLVLRSQFPQFDSSELASRMTQRLNLPAPLSTAALRKLLQRARETFSEFLLDEVVASIQSTDRNDLEIELIACGLWEYCRCALEKRCRNAKDPC
jgi:RNA polymerase sigma-70 factor (ECF subfamily)